MLKRIFTHDLADSCLTKLATLVAQLVASCCSIWLVFDGVVSGGEGRCSTIIMV